MWNPREFFKNIFKKPKEKIPSDNLTESNEYSYINEKGLTVFTEKYLLERGYCCENGCKHCPYGYRKPPINKS